MKKQSQSISLNEAIDNDIGKKGTKERDKFDAKVKDFLESWAGLIQPFNNLGKAANKTTKAFETLRGPLYRATFKPQSQSITWIVLTAGLILAIVEIIYFSIRYGIFL